MPAVITQGTTKGTKAATDEALDRVSRNVADEALESAAYRATHDAPRTDAEFARGVEDGVEAVAKKPDALDRIDQASMYAWNGPMVIPFVTGAGAWLATKGKELGPVLGAPLRGLGHIFGAPKQVMDFEVQDFANLKSGMLFKRAQGHVNSAEMSHIASLKELRKAQKALKNGGFTSEAESLSGAGSAFADAHAVVAAGPAPRTVRNADLEILGELAPKQKSAAIFSAAKAQTLDSSAVTGAFDSAVSNAAGMSPSALKTQTSATATQLTQKQMKALKKAQAHMERFAEHAGNMQTHLSDAEPLRRQARDAARGEWKRKEAILTGAEEKLGKIGRSVEDTVSQTGWLNGARNKIAAYFDKRAAGHAVNAAKRHAKGMERIDTAINALSGNSKFDELRAIAEEAKATHGALPTSMGHSAIDRAGTRFSSMQDKFGEAAQKLAKEGNLSKAEKQALSTAKVNFKGRMFGFWGAGKKISAAHEALGAQGAFEAKATFTRDLSEGFQGLPRAISKLNLEKSQNTLLTGATQLVAVGRSAQVSHTGFREFKEVYADLQGKSPKHVSTLKALAQLVPFTPAEPALQLARKQFWGNVGPRLIGYAGGAVAFQKAMGRGLSGGAQLGAIAAQMVISGGGEMLGSRSGMLEVYEKADKNFKSGHMTAADYAGIAVRSKVIDKQPENPQALNLLSEDYLKNNTHPEEMLRDIASGKFLQLYKAKVSEVAAQAAAAPAETAQQPQEPVTTTARDRLTKGAMGEQPAVGVHTKKEANRRIGKAALLAGDTASVASIALD